MIYYPVLRPGTRGTSRAVWRTLPAGIREREVGHRAASCQLLLRGCPCCPKGCFCLFYFFGAGGALVGLRKAWGMDQGCKVC